MDDVNGDMTKAVVLYAEDVETDRFFMQMAFRKAGMAECLRMVPDGAEAVDYLAGIGVYGDREQHPLPAVMLLDLSMPNMGGFEVLEWMRAHAEAALLPVVVFTSSAREEDRAKALGLGEKDYWEKPSSGLEFAKVLERVREKWLSAGPAAGGSEAGAGASAAAPGV